MSSHEDLFEKDGSPREANVRILVVDASSARGLLAALACMESERVELDPAVAFVITADAERIETGYRGYAERTKPFVPQTQIPIFHRMRKDGLKSQVSPYGRAVRKGGPILRQSAKKARK